MKQLPSAPIAALASASLGIFAGLVFQSALLGLSLSIAGVGLWWLAAMRAYARWLLSGSSHDAHLPEPFRAFAAVARRKSARARERQRRLASQIRAYDQFANTVPYALVSVTADGRIEWLSALACQYFGLKPGDVGTRLTALLRDPELIRLLDAAESQAFAEMPSPVEHELRLELRLARFADGRRLLAAHDASEINRLLSMRQDFIANVSHELRTPLTVIHGYLEQLVEGGIDFPTTQLLIKRLVSPTARMRSLVEDLLLLTKLESSPVPAISTLPAVDVSAMLTMMVAEARSIATPRHRLLLDADAGLRVLGVERELWSAFNNLIVNAVRYSPEGGDIHIRWRLDNGGARFEVDDHGVGIAAEHIRRITERFYRVDLARSRASGGTGLGLAIVKHALRRHGSELACQSTPGSGSRMSFVLPAERVVTAVAAVIRNDADCNDSTRLTTIANEALESEPPAECEPDAAELLSAPGRERSRLS